ncbi:phytoceramidase, alkaline, isoform CRA_d [Gorgonomyces haynaldii]|nr:phytoceramidase, alkaline, isoform CRA_d [Gorgonomyces haynaldii]
MGFDLPPAGNQGHWGPVTATLDWCEENYVVSKYIAEWVNTWTNLNYLILCFLGIYNALHTYNSTGFIFSHLGMAVVGVGSFLFHMTLTYEMQLADELPMIYWYSD